MEDGAEHPFYILTIDGGGIRGIYPAHLLRRMQQEFRLDFPRKFGLIAGTSTGAILAAALATEMDLGLVATLYEEQGQTIFQQRPMNFRGIAKSMYGKDRLRLLLKGLFGELTLSDAKTRLILPATDLTNGTVHVFKSAYDPTFVRDKRVSVASAVLASCSAPIYFPPERVDEYLIADGGLWANNPALGALVEAVSRLKVPLSRIRLLSIGTGDGRQKYSIDDADAATWGAWHWGPRQFVDLILSLQSSTSANMARLLLDKQYMRVDFQLTSPVRLDDVAAVGDLKARADHDFTHLSAHIREFLQV